MKGSIKSKRNKLADALCLSGTPKYLLQARFTAEFFMLHIIFFDLKILEFHQLFTEIYGS
jgi:hypothetical protein